MTAGSKGDGRRQALGPVHQHIGARLRLARTAAKMSQERLAAGLGVTFQQVQKYEKGTSRISASRLHRAASVLDLPVSFFFPEPGPMPPSSPGPGEPPERSAAELMEFLSMPEGVELGKAFAGIGDPELRRRVVELVRSVSKNTGEEPES